MLNSPHPHHSTRGAVKKSLKVSFWEGYCAASMQGIIDNYMTPFAMALGAGARQIGWLASMPPLAGALVQWFSGYLTRLWRGRKIVYRRAVAVQTATLWAVALVPWLPAGQRIVVLVILAVAIQVFGGLTGPVWHSLMSQYVPPSKRTGYFGWRGRWIGMFVILFGLMAGWLLHGFDRRVLWGFSLLFVFAGTARLVSWLLIGQLYEPPRSHRTVPPGHFADFREKSRGSSFGVFIAVIVGIAFFTSLSGPYFSYFMLKRLDYSYITYAVMTATVGFTSSVMVAVWGKQADRVGATRIFKFCAWLTPVMPWLWIFSGNPKHVLFFQIASGLVWSGYNVCATNYLFEVVPSAWRTQAVAYFNVAQGLANCAGALAGGYFLSIAPPLLGFPFKWVLVVSGAGRLLVCILLLKYIKPPRTHPEVSNWNIVSHAVGIEEFKQRRRRKKRFST